MKSPPFAHGVYNWPHFGQRCLLLVALLVSEITSRIIKLLSLNEKSQLSAFVPAYHPASWLSLPSPTISHLSTLKRCSNRPASIFLRPQFPVILLDHPDEWREEHQESELRRLQNLCKRKRTNIRSTSPTKSLSSGLHYVYDDLQKSQSARGAIMPPSHCIMNFSSLQTNH